MKINTRSLLSLSGMVTALIFATLLLVQPAGANNPISVTSSGQPVKWATFPILYTVDGGNLGALTPAEASALTAQAFGAWTGVSTAAVSATQNGTGLGTDGDISDIGEFNALGCAASNPVIYDSDGSITDALYGAGASNSILGFAGPCAINGAGVILRGRAVMNGKPITSNSGLTLSRSKGVFIHELGHFLGLGHSQVNLNCLTNLASCPDGSADLNGVPTMFPILLNQVESAGTSYSVSLASDDISAISTLYPSATFATTTGTISGTVFFSDNVNQAQGINVIARRIGDPRVTAISNTSGAFAQANRGNIALGLPASGAGDPDFAQRGVYTIPGLPPGTYTVEIESVNSSFIGGSSVGALSTGNGRNENIPIPLPAVAECYGGPESATDNPATCQNLSVTAGSNTPGTNFILNDGGLAAMDAFDTAARNDSIATATPISTGTISASLSAANGPDVDFYAINVVSGQAITVETRSRRLTPSRYLDTVIDLQDAAGNRLATCAIGENGGPFNQPCVDDDFTTGGNLTKDSKFTFNPGFTGVVFLEVTDHFGDSRPDFQYDLVVSGAAPVPDVTFSPAAVDFGSQPIGIASSTQIVEVRNNSAVTVTLNPFSITGTNSAEFSFAAPGFPACNTGSTTGLTAGNSCLIGLKFTPAAAGVRTGNVHVTYTGGTGGSADLPLTGTGASGPTNDDFANAASLNTNPFSDFQNTTLATKQAIDDTLSVGSCGAFPANDKSIWYKYLIPADGSMDVTLTTSYNAILAYGFDGALTPSNCHLIPAFNSSSPTLTVGVTGFSGHTIFFMIGAQAGDGGTTSVGFTFKPTGIDTDLSVAVTDNNLVFTEGTSGIYNVTVSNNGGTTATSAGIPVVVRDFLPAGFTYQSVSGSGWSCSAVSSLVTCTLSGTIAHSGTSQFSLTVLPGPPAAAGSPVTNTVQVFGGGDITPINNIATDQTTVNPAPAPVVNLSPPSADFGNVNVGSTSATQTFTLLNGGQGVLNITSITKTGTDIAHYNLLLSPTPGFTCLAGANTLAGSASCTFGVNFAPTTGGTKNASISVVSNASTSPNTVSLTGLAIAPGTITFTGTIGTLWTTAGNWDLGRIPVPGDTVVIPTGFNVTLSSGAQTIATLTKAGTGTLTISGGSLTTTGASTATNVTISGGILTANGTLAVSGALTLSSGTLNGSGNVSVSSPLTWSGGTMSGSGTFTNNGTGAGAAVISGGTLNGKTFLNAGTLNFTDGAVLTFTDAILTNQATGTMNALGAGNITKTLGASAQFNNQGAFNRTGTAGTFEFAGMDFNNTGTTTIDATGEIKTNQFNYSQTTGTTVVNGRLNTQTGVTVITGGVVQGTGTIKGDLASSITNNGGRIQPGNSAGILTISTTGAAGYTQSATGILDIQIGGTTVGTQYDQLNLTVNASINGTLNVTLINSFVPALNDSFTILTTTGTRTGTFSTTNLPALPAGLQWNPVTYNASSVVLSVSAVATVSPTISKAFGAANIPFAGTTSLTLTITNPNAGLALTGVAVTDGLPGGLVVSTPNGLVGTCTGVTAVAGSSSVSLSGQTLAASASCTITVNVTGTTAGAKNNQTGTVSSNETGVGGQSNIATVTVLTINPPTISKAFGAANIPFEGTTSLTFTITNPNGAFGLTGVTFADNFPPGLVISTPSGLSTTCGGTMLAVAGSNNISLTSGTLTAGGSCTISMNVTATTSGAKANTTGQITSTESGPGATSNTATVTVGPATAPTISKAFGAANIPFAGTTSLTFTITNQNGMFGLTGVTFADNFPPGLVISTPSGLSNTCGGTMLAVAGSNNISLTSGTLTAGGSCTISMNVTATTSGAKANTTGQITSTESGPGATSNTATVTVGAATAPTINKAFGAGTIGVNGTTSLTFTITNPNGAFGLTGVTFADNFPLELVISTPNALSNTCGGTAVAVAGSNNISLTAGTLVAGGTCTFSMNVTATSPGAKSNTTGQITSTESGPGATSNTAILNVVAIVAPTISKSFGTGTIGLGGTTTLTFSINNSNVATALSGVTFTDALPSGLVVATPNGLTGICGAGTITTVAGAGTVSLSGGTIVASGTCNFTVNVTGTSVGSKSNTTGAVSSTESGAGATSNTAILNVVGIASPTFSKAFGAASIAINASTSLTFTLTNSNVATALSGIAFTDALPTGLVVATPNGLSGVCGAGTITAVAGTGTVSLSGGTLVASGTCNFTVNVTGVTGGVKNNVTGTVTSTEGGVGGTASASLNVVAVPPTISKAFGAATIPLNGTTSLTFSLSNPNAGSGLTGVAFSDNFPAGLVMATPNGLSTDCGGAGTATATPGSGLVTLAGENLTAGSACLVVLNVTGTTAGGKANTSGVISATESGAGATSNTANLIVVAPLTFTKAFGAAAVPVGGTTSLTFTITNPNPAVSHVGVAFTDTLPAGVVVATPNNLSNTCGGTPTAAQGTNSVTLSAGTVAALCTINIDVTGTTAGAKNNVTGNISSTTGGTGGTASASFVVAVPPTITKAFGAGTIGVGGTTTMTFNISNPNAGTSLTGIAFTDILPSGLLVATPNGQTGTCTGTITATQGTGTVTLSGMTLAASGSCTLVVNVTGTTVGAKLNTTGPISSTEGGIGATSNTATLTVVVVSPPTLTKAFGAASIPLAGTTSLTFTVTNANVSTSLTGIAFTDTLPAGLVVATPNGQTGTCTGTITATAGTGTVSLSAMSLAAGASCTLVVNVTGTTAGVKNNTSGAISATETGAGATSNTATITVVAPPTITKAFGVGTILVGANTSLTFVITNPNATTALTAVVVTDALPAGLVIATPNGLTGSCGAGTITATSGTGSITLAGGTLAASNSCTFAVNVTGSTTGLKTNTTGTVSSAEGGTGTTSNTVTVTVNNPAPVITSFVPTHSAAGAGFTLTVDGPAGSFVASSVVNFNGTAKTTTFVNGAQLTAVITAADVATAGAVNVSVTTPAPGGGTSGTLPFTIDDYILSGPAATVVITAGQSAVCSIAVTPTANGFANGVQFSVTGVPSASTTSFAPPSVTPGASVTTILLTIFTTARPGASGTGSGKPSLPLSGLPSGWLALLALLTLGLTPFAVRLPSVTRMRFGRIGAVAVLLLVSGYLAGCAGTGFPEGAQGTPAGTYTLTVTGTSGTALRTATCTLKVN